VCLALLVDEWPRRIEDGLTANWRAGIARAVVHGTILAEGTDTRLWPITTTVARMGRAGKELEELVATLEAATARYPIQVTSPDHLTDKETGSRREVDVTLRGSIGSVELLVVFECRDRSKRDDVTWIEQLIAKTKSVGADKIVAVSTSGFSGPAAKKAEANGIELRTVERFDTQDVIEWMSLAELEGMMHRREVRDNEVYGYADMPPLNVFGLTLEDAKDVHSLPFVRWPSCEPVTYEELVEEALGPFDEDAFEVGQDYRVVIPGVGLRTADGPRPLASMTMVVQLVPHEVRLPFAGVHRYQQRTDAEPIETVDFRGEFWGEPLAVRFFRNGEKFGAIVEGSDLAKASLTIEAVTPEDESPPAPAGNGTGSDSLGAGGS
jgi:hypothetical protein